MIFITNFHMNKLICNSLAGIYIAVYSHIDIIHLWSTVLEPNHSSNHLRIHLPISKYKD